MPGLLQRVHQRPVAQHRTELRHAQIGRANAHGRLAHQSAQRGRRLRNHHLGDGLGRCRRPGLQALQQLHAAQRQSQRARVGTHIAVGGRASNRLICACGNKRLACKASASPAGPAPTTAKRQAVCTTG
jgi:hypothetical protein